MTDTTENNDQTTALDPGPDWFLGQLVEWANRFGVELGVTLNVRGLIVSGQIISGRSYFNRLADEMVGQSNEDSLQYQLANIVRQHKSIYEPYDLAFIAERRDSDGDAVDNTHGSDDSASPDEETPPPVAYVHLKDARVFSPGQTPLPTNGGVLWRGRLKEVDGFWLGQLRVD